MCVCVCVCVSWKKNCNEENSSHDNGSKYHMIQYDSQPPRYES